MPDSRFKTSEMDDLLDAILELRNSEEAYSFFEDLCTITELQAMSQRFRVARMLSNKCTSKQIAEDTGSSTATIARVNKCLHYGSGGYAMVLARTQEGARTKNESER